MLRRIIDEKWLTAKAVIGIFPANSIGDDIEIYANGDRMQVKSVVHHLRQQRTKSTRTI